MVHEKWAHCPASSFCTISQFLWEKNAKGEIWTSWLTGGHEAFHIQKHTFSRAGRKDTNSGVNENWTQTGAGRKDATTSLLQKAPLPLHQMNGGMGTCRKDAMSVLYLFSWLDYIYVYIYIQYFLYIYVSETGSIGSFLLSWSINAEFGCKTPWGSQHIITKTS